MNFIQKNWKGILVCLVMAVPCWLLGQRFPIVGGPVFGILAGTTRVRRSPASPSCRKRYCSTPSSCSASA